jgi:SAM-dependent methyltransferase
MRRAIGEAVTSRRAMVDTSYTADDHDFRENDDYARAKYDVTLRWLGPARGRRLLNIGCGAGLFNQLAHDAGFSVEACEPDPSAHSLAVSVAPDGVIVHLGGLFDAPLERGADVVVMHDVLEHIADEASAVAALRGLIGDDGTVIISVPALPALFGLHDEMLGHHRRYTRRTLRQGLEAGFSIHRLRYFGLSLIPVTLWFSRWRRQPYPTAAATGPSLVGRLFALVCRSESYVAMPLGTSLICEARPSSNSPRSTTP